jgi:hypothetical protein
MTRADIVPVRAIMSPASIQSQTWTFPVETDQIDPDEYGFNRAVALLAELDWVAEDRAEDQALIQAVGLPGGNWLGRALHLRSKYHAVRRYAGSYSQIVLACVLAMSSVNRPIMTVSDMEAGAKITSYLPMDLWSVPGTLSLDIHADDQLITVEGYALIPGQLFDWFRGRREINRVLQDVQHYLVAMGKVGA